MKLPFGWFSLWRRSIWNRSLWRSSATAFIVLGGMGLFLGWMAVSSQKEQSPYIDAIKKRWTQIEEEKREDGELIESDQKGSYTERQRQMIQEKDSQQENEAIRQGAPPEVNEAKGYSQKLKLELGPSEKIGDGKYLNREQAKLKDKEDPSENESAIQKFKDGKSELEMKRVGKIKGTGGFRFGVNSTRTIEADVQTRNRQFTDIYPPGRTPDLQFFYEYQPFRSEVWGSLGLYTAAGLSYRAGVGRFERAPYDPSQQVMGAAENAAGRYNDETEVKFTFFTFPLSAGLGYRFLAARWIVPYAIIAPTTIIYSERRSSPRGSDWGRSNALTQIVGVAFAMDWLDKASSWSMYEALSVKRIYFNLDYYRLSDLGNNEVRFSTTAFFAGFSFDI